jgi:signal transduction histidine kinase
MQSSAEIRFSKRYQSALRIHLRTPTRGRASRLRARTLGRTAMMLRMDTFALIRIHDQVLASLQIPGQQPRSAQHSRHRTHASWFLAEALPPIMQYSAVDPKSLRRTHKLERLLAERTAELATIRLQMRRATARRRTVEARLAQGSRHYSELLAKSERMEEQARNLARQVLLAQEEERREISRDLHDDVAQILAGINVQLAGLKDAAAQHGRSLRRRITQAQRLVGKSVEVVHRYARELRPALLDDLGLIPALRSFIRNMPGRNGLEVRFTAFSTVEAVDSTRRTVLYRVAQEALTNVARHAHAKVATLRISRRGDAVHLVVHDDGKSFEPDRVLNSRSNNRLGLLGMRERVEMVGGTFAIHSTPATGTTVRVEIPLHKDGSKTP